MTIHLSPRREESMRMHIHPWDNLVTRFHFLFFFSSSSSTKRKTAHHNTYWSSPAYFHSLSLEYVRLLRTAVESRVPWTVKIIAVNYVVVSDHRFHTDGNRIVLLFVHRWFCLQFARSEMHARAPARPLGFSFRFMFGIIDELCIQTEMTLTWWLKWSCWWTAGDSAQTVWFAFRRFVISSR